MAENLTRSVIEIGDAVKLKRDVTFWEIGGGRTEVLRKAGTEYPVVDVVIGEALGSRVTLEYYDPVLKNAWFSELVIDDIELVWKVVRKA